MKRNLLSTILLLILFLLLTPSPSFCERRIDKEKGMCFDTALESILKNLVPEKKHSWLITIDGMDPKASAFLFWFDMPTIYVYEAIDQEAREKFKQKKNGVIVAFPWSRDIQDTEKAVKRLYEQIKFYNQRKESVVILAHSWGSVIAYITLIKFEDIYVDKLITLGSPLMSKNPTISDKIKTFLYLNRINSVKKPLNVKQWRNYSVKCDPIASFIKGLPEGENLIWKKNNGTASECHSAYFQAENAWKSILKEAME